MLAPRRVRASENKSAASVAGSAANASTLSIATCSARFIVWLVSTKKTRTGVGQATLHNMGLG